MPGQRGAAAAGEQPEPVGEAPGDLGQRQRPQPGGGELDRQREPVQPGDDVGRPAGGSSSSSVKSGLTAAARSANSRTAGSSPRGGTTNSDSPVMPSGSLLVATIRSLGLWASSASARWAHASMRCSQLSRTSSALASARPSSSRVRASRLVIRCVPSGSKRVSRRPTEPRTAFGTSAASVTEASSAIQIPSGASPVVVVAARSAATSAASRVLPAPPGPTSVTRRYRSRDFRTPGYLVLAADEAGELGPQVRAGAAGRPPAPRRPRRAAPQGARPAAAGPGRCRAHRRAGSAAPRTRPARPPAARLRRAPASAAR